MTREDRLIEALRSLNRVAQAAATVVAREGTTRSDLRTLAEVLTEYESSDAYDAVTDFLYIEKR